VQGYENRKAFLVLSATAVGALAVTALAGGVTPAQGLARQLKTSMQAYYARSVPGLRFTTVTCKISADRASARCNAHFTVASKHAAGVFVVAVAAATGGKVTTKTLSVTCRDTRTGARRAC
jgi:hypothetical protein